MVAMAVSWEPATDGSQQATTTSGDGYGDGVGGGGGGVGSGGGGVGGGGGDERETSLVELYAVMVILSVLGVVGTVGNAIVLYVFGQKKDKLVSTLFILALAGVDLVTCLVVIPFTVYMEYVDFRIRFDAVCKAYQFLITSNIPFSALVMVVIAVDRYLCICHPFLRAMNFRRAKLIIAVLAVVAAGLGVCVALMFGVYQTIDMTSMTSTDGGDVVGRDAANWTNDVGIDVDNDEEEEYIRAASRRRADELSTSSIVMSLSHRGGSYGDGDEVNGSSSRSSGNVDDSADSPPPLSRLILSNVGHCQSNDIVVGQAFQYYYQKFYTVMYLACLLVVVVLYVLIYRSVLDRRTWRQKQKTSASAATTMTTTIAQTVPQAMPLVVEGDDDDVEATSRRRGNQRPTKLRQQQQQQQQLLTGALSEETVLMTCVSNDDFSPSTTNGSTTPMTIGTKTSSFCDVAVGDDVIVVEPIKAGGGCDSGGELLSAAGSRLSQNGCGVDGSRLNKKKKTTKQKPATIQATTTTTADHGTRLANLKTAAMLFVVTVVFVATFMPAFLMALAIVPYNMTVFYMYFANNVANPVIYSFMNKNFREDLWRLFSKLRKN